MSFTEEDRQEAISAYHELPSIHRTLAALGQRLRRCKPGCHGTSTAVAGFAPEGTTDADLNMFGTAATRCRGSTGREGRGM